jgi:lipid-binding SYLF domain-containing protein
MRSGLWFSGAGGSGVLLARKADGGWSPPSGIMVHAAGPGFIIGVDIYDCVVVINSQEALDAFTSIRCTFGNEVKPIAGPVDVDDIADAESDGIQAPLFTYFKSRGFHADIQIDGTVVVERSDENERFYGERIGAADILMGGVRHPTRGVNSLLQTIKVVQGDEDADVNVMPSGPAPGDVEVERSDHIFSIPDADDPDPYGVRALEMEGLEIVEAGTRSRPSSNQFEFRPSPTSPVRHRFSGRNSQDWSPTTTRPRSEQLPPPARLPHAHSRSMSVDHATQTEPVVDEEPEVEAPTVSNVTQVTAISKAKLVTIPRRLPPPLPPRSLNRRGPLVIDAKPAADGRPWGRSDRVGDLLSSEPEGVVKEESVWEEEALHGRFHHLKHNTVTASRYGHKDAAVLVTPTGSEPDTTLVDKGVGANSDTDTDYDRDDYHQTVEYPTAKKITLDTSGATQTQQRGASEDPFYSTPSSPVFQPSPVEGKKHSVHTEDFS